METINNNINLIPPVANSDVIVNIDTLLDAFQAFLQDCDHPNLRKLKNVDSFVNKYKLYSDFIQSNRLNVNHFYLLKTIGQGAYGEIHLVKHKESNAVYAMKVLNKAAVVKRPDAANYWEERFIMAYTSNDWIIKMHYSFQDSISLYFIMDYLPGGDLVNLMANYDIPESWAKFYCAEAILALEVIHQLGFIHRDIKPDNMLLDKNGHLKLADFGTAIKLNKDGLVKADKAIGTPDYISPEVLKSQSEDILYGKECDWWSMGVFLYELLIGETPFYAESLLGTYTKIMEYSKYLQFPAEAQISNDSKDIIKSFLSDRNQRLGMNGIDEIKNHSFFKNDRWNFQNIRNCIAPVIPNLNSDEDTNNFDEFQTINDSNPLIVDSKVFVGSQLPFIGFTHDPDSLQLSELMKDNINNKVVEAVKKELNELKFKYEELNNRHNICLNQLEDLSNNAKEESLLETKEPIIEENTEMQILLTKVEELESKMEENETLNNRLALQYQIATDKLEFIQKKEVELTKKLQAEKEKESNLKKTISEFTLDNEVKSNMIQTLENQLLVCQKTNSSQLLKIESLEMQLNKEYKTWNEVSHKTQDLENRWDDLQLILEKMKLQEEKLLMENKNLNNQLSQLNKEKMIWETGYKDFNSKIISTTPPSENAFNDRIDGSNKKTPKKKPLNILSVEFKLLQRQFSELESELTHEIKKNQELSAQLDKEIDSKSHFQLELSQMTIDYEALQSKETDYLEQIQDIQSLTKELQEQISKLKVNISMNERHIHELTEQLDPLQYSSKLDKAQIKDQLNELEIKQNLILILRGEKSQLTNRLGKAITKLNNEKLKSSKIEDKLKEISKNAMNEIEGPLGKCNEADLHHSIDALIKDKNELLLQLETYQNDLAISKDDVKEERQAKDLALNKIHEIKSKKLRPLDRIQKNLAVEVRRKDRELKKIQQSLILEKKKCSEFEIYYQKEFASLTSQLSQEYNSKVKLKEEIDRLQCKLEEINQPSPLTSPSLKKNLTDICIEGLLFIRSKHNLRRRESWKRQFVKANNLKLTFYNSEAEKQNNHPNFALEIKKLFHVRAVTQGDVIRVGPEDIQRIFQVLYVQEDVNKSDDKIIDSEKKTVKYKGHDLVPINVSTGDVCDLCNLPLSETLRSSSDFECKRCKMKIHKIHVEQSDEAIGPCKVTYDNACAKEMLLLAKNRQEQQLWISKLNQAIQRIKTPEIPSQLTSPPVRSQTRTQYKN